MFAYINHAMVFFSQHVLIGHFAHTIGGFGLALLLQHYLRGNAFLPPLIGWVMLGVSLLIYLIAFMS